MTAKEKDFIKWYRHRFRDDPALPCLKCEDTKIIKCTKLETGSCIKFSEYTRKYERGNQYKKVKGKR
jgi:hypothetical protein